MAKPWPPTQEATDADLVSLELSVDALNINIGKGDGAIYLLIEHAPHEVTAKHADKPFIHRAVLIDGGVGGPSAKVIKHVLETRIPEMYYWDKTQGGRLDLKHPAFDSIVVTHWDIDHHGGLVKFIQDEVLERSEESGFNQDDYLCNYMKYAKDGGPQRGLRAKTTFYAPYWGGKGFPGHGRLISTDQTLPDVYLNWNYGRGKTRSKKTIVNKICKLRTGLDKILGCNLFTGETPQYENAQKMISPQHLAVWHQTHKSHTDHPVPVAEVDAWPVWPVLCIVAGANKGLNECCGDKCGRPDNEIATIQNNLMRLGDDAEPASELEPELKQRYGQKRVVKNPPASHLLVGPETEVELPKNPIPRFKPVQRVVDVPLNPGDDSEYTNMNSLISMVIWTTGQLSSYQGGDANWEGEMKVVAWCQQDKNPFKCVRSVKLSHHGSADSTPYELIRSFRPRNIIISADTNSFGHPRWEVVLYLDLWFRATYINRIVVHLDNRVHAEYFVRATSYPRYIAFDQEVGKAGVYLRKPDISYDAFLSEAKDEYKKYQKMMGLLIEKLYGAEDPYIKTLRGLKGEKQTREYVYGLVASSWKSLSEIGVEAAIADETSSVREDRFQQINPDDKVLFIKTFCRPNDQARRERADRYLDGAAFAVKTRNTEAELYNWALASNEPEVMGGPSFMKGHIPAKRNAVTSRAYREQAKDANRVKAAALLSKAGRAAEVAGRRFFRALTYGQYQDISRPPQALTARPLKAVEDSATLGTQISIEGVTPPPNSKFYVVVDSEAEDWKSQALGPLYQISSGPEEDDFDEMASFILQLDQSVLEVEDNFQLSLTDPFRSWLLQAMQADPSNASNRISLSLLGTDTKTKVASMRLELESSAARPAISFSTDSLQLNFADRSLPSLKFRQPIVPSSGFYGVHSFYCFGLLPSSKITQWSISQVFIQSNVNTVTPENSGAALATVLNKLTTINNLEFALTKGMIWFLPSDDYLTVQRLEWTLADAAQKSLQSWCHEWISSNFTIQNATVVSRRECTKTDLGADTGFSFDHEVLFMFDITRENIDPTKDYVITCGLDLNIQAGSKMLTATIRIDPASDTTKVGLVDFVSWLVPSVDIQAVKGIIPVIENVLVRSVELQIAQPASGVSIDRISVKAEYQNPDWKVTSGSTKENVPLLLTYTWTKGRAQPHAVNLKLWLEPAILDWFSPQIMPRYEDLYYIRPSSIAPSGLSLQDLMPGDDYQLPAELSLVITELSMELQDTTVTFTGKLQRDAEAAENTTTFGIMLDEVDLTASFKWSEKKPGEQPGQQKKSSFEINLNTEILLVPSTQRASISSSNTDPKDGDIEVGVVLIDGAIPDKYARVICDVTLQKSQDQWNFQLTGSGTDLTMAHLGVFFPPGDGNIIVELLGHVAISALNIEYNYGGGATQKPPNPNAPKGAQVSDFSMSAGLLLDELELDVQFNRDQDMWFFEATLDSADKSLTVGKVVSSLVGEKGAESVIDIPGFVRDINLSKAAIKFSIQSIAATDANDKSALSICLAIDIPGPDNTILEFAFLQIINKPTPTTAPPNIQNATKRMVKVTLNSLPWNKIPKVPVIDKIKPAFDSLAFYWILDPTWRDATKPPGLTRQEVQRLSELSPILFKETKKATFDTTSDQDSASAVVLAAGMHFLVLDSAGLGTPHPVLDYLFNNPRAPSSMLSRALTSTQSQLFLQDINDTPAGTSKATLEKVIGPFGVSNVGLRYQDSELIIYLDITANLGPIKLSLMGFGFGFNLEGTSLKDLALQVPSFHLQGMGIELNKPPIQVAGLFVERETETVKSYVGGITLTITPYSFLAVGGYGEIRDKNTGGNFKSVFFFAKLNGPLIELEFVTIGGICLGFGYNSDIRLPSIKQLPTFPFIANASLPGNDPLSVMQTLSGSDPKTGVVSPRESSFWLAAGLEAKALEVLDVSAVIILEFNPYVSLGIFAKAIGQMPPAPTPREACFLYVELELLATLELGAGAMRIEAYLSPNSFVMGPACRLTGGFALCYWFPPSGYAGDFVFTVGGYHNAFQVPAHYPKPPRLGIDWNVNGLLTITGEAYFAITPKACMGGGKLKANYNLGLLHAWITVWADFLMEYHPFKFIADIGVEVGVHFTLEILFISIDIGISIRAELTLWGVPFGGEVYVDFWVFGFTIGFGASQENPAIDLNAFRDLLMQVPDADSAAASGTSAGSVNRLHIMSVESGRYSDKVKASDTTTKQGDIWEVKRGGFVFRVQSRVPLQSISEPDFAANSVGGLVTSVSSNKEFYARPMQLQSQLTSTMTLKITKEEDKEEDNEVMEFTVAQTVVKQVPLALWGYYDPAKAPGRNKNNISELLDPKDGTVELMMGASFKCPPPKIAEDHLVPFDVLQSASQDVFTDADAEQPGGDEHPKLRGDVVFQDGTWSSAEPFLDDANKAKQWESVRDTWKAPELTIDGEDIVNAVAALWSAGFAWSFGTGGDNELKNELSNNDGASPIVWDMFEDVYMAAPLLGVTA